MSTHKPEILVGPFRYWRDGQKILMRHPKHGDTNVLDVRSWGFLTGCGHAALALDNETAATEQDRFGEWVASTLNLLMKKGTRIVADYDLAKIQVELEGLRKDLYENGTRIIDSDGVETDIDATFKEHSRGATAILDALLNPDADSVRWSPRGIGYNSGIPDLVTGKTDGGPDCSGFVGSRAEGELAVRIFGGRAYLDWRDFEPNWCQVKVRCDEPVLEALIKLVSANGNMLTRAIVAEAITHTRQMPEIPGAEL